MKPLPSYVFLAPNASSPEMGAGFVLQTKEPYYLGRIIKLNPKELAVAEYVREYKPFIYADIFNYSILIAFAGTLAGNKLRANGPEWEKELQAIYNDMADWFKAEKIDRNIGYYNRFKID